MNSFLRSVRLTFENRDGIIKESLIANLSENIREIQFEYNEMKNKMDTQPTLELFECTTSLCTTIEAIFLHGLKDSFLRQTINVISGEIDRRPEPNFWPALLVFSHKQTIELIQSLSQIQTDIGQCRSWIRQSLNENILTAYLTNMRKNSSALSPYYQRSAFCRDVECMEMAERIIGGIEMGFQFALPYNSSLLNQWTYHPLQLAGLYTPPMRSSNITSGIDVASSITDPLPIVKSHATNEVFSQSISNSPFASSTPINEEIDEDIEVAVEEEEEKFDHDEKIKKILQMATENDNNKIESKAKELDETNDNIKVTKDNLPASKNLGKLLDGWSSSIESDEKMDANNEQRRESVTFSRSTSINSIRSRSDHHSYSSLFSKQRSAQKIIDIKEVWERFEMSLGMTDGSGVIGIENLDKKDNDDSETIQNELGFEMVPTAGLHEQFSLKELEDMVQISYRIANEKGIDSQNFLCKSCPNPLVIGSAAAPQICAFSGGYFCDSCMCPEPQLIPARVINNWDFRKSLVSNKAALFLSEFQHQPFIDLKILNPDIYQAVDDMARLQSLRIQLNYIRAYLFTCCESIIEKLQKLMWTKEYLYEHIHRYSIADLYAIPKGQLAQQLNKAVAFGKNHIKDCKLCSGKGFYCEICSSPNVIYPFEMDTTFRCKQCFAVFHAECLNETMPCPKCARKRRREDLPLLEAVDSITKSPSSNIVDSVEKLQILEHHIQSETSDKEDTNNENTS